MWKLTELHRKVYRMRETMIYLQDEIIRLSQENDMMRAALLEIAKEGRIDGDSVKLIASLEGLDADQRDD